MSTVRRYFDRQAPAYLTGSGRGFWKIIRAREADAVMTALCPLSGMNYLELGCGAGFYTALLAKCAPARLVAVDFSHDMISRIRIPGAIRVQADVQNIPFKGSFDRILCAGVLEFLTNPETCLSNAKSLLAPEGIMVLLVPPRSLAGRIYRYFHRGHDINIRLFDLHDMESMLSQARLKIDSFHRPTPMTHVLKVIHG